MALPSRAMWPLGILTEALGRAVQSLLFRAPSGVTVTELPVTLTDRFVDPNGHRHRRKFTAWFRVYRPDNWNGQTTLAIHGFAGHPQAYDQVFTAYAADTGELTYAVHVPSHGSTDDISGPDATIRVVALIAQSVRVLEMGPVLIIGHSLGAGLALCVARKLARRNRRTVRGVVAYATPTGNPALERRPPPRLPTVIRLGSLVPGVVGSVAQAQLVALARRQGGSYAAGLGSYFTHTPRLRSARDILFQAEPLMPVARDLVNLGIVPQMPFAVFDPAIEWWWPWLSFDMPGQVRLVWGGHASILAGVGPSYWALLRARAAALGEPSTHPFCPPRTASPEPSYRPSIVVAASTRRGGDEPCPALTPPTGLLQ